MKIKSELQEMAIEQVQQAVSDADAILAKPSRNDVFHARQLEIAANLRTEAIKAYIELMNAAPFSKPADPDSHTALGISA